MNIKNNLINWSMHVTNLITGLVGIVLILVSIIIGVNTTIAVILLSVGTSILASAVVTWLHSRYFFRQNNSSQLIQYWGIDKIYKTRSEINTETNELLKQTKKLEICAMGLKNFRDAQGKIIEKRISEGMFLKILTLDPCSSFLPIIDQTENVVIGSTKTDIASLLEWVRSLKKFQIVDNQIEIKTYDHYPYDFYFNMDGIVFTGPYQNKKSQQTITYKFSANTLGAKIYEDYFSSLWEM